MYMKKLQPKLQHVWGDNKASRFLLLTHPNQAQVPWQQPPNQLHQQDEKDPVPGSAALAAMSSHLKHGWEHTPLLNAPPCSWWKPSSSLKLAVIAPLSN